MTDREPDLPAGDFAGWLAEIRGALRGDRGSAVPCGGCTACCTSSQFVHVGPDETDSLASIPSELLFPAPGLPPGHVLLGYDERGRCPLLDDGGCSIYEHRPRACRTYDCRVFPAAGVEPDEDQPLVRDRARRWRFSYQDESGRVRHAAVRAAATFLARHPEALPDGVRATRAAQRAVLALRISEQFLGTDGRELVEPTTDHVRDMVLGT